MDPTSKQKFGFLNINGQIYEGEIENGQRHGIGKCIDEHGNCYEGEWRNDERQGFGTETLSSGEKYQGYWNHNKREGQGVCIYPNGNLFEGKWKSNEQISGKIVFNNRGYFEGEWKSGLPFFGTLVNHKENGKYIGSVFVRSDLSVAKLKCKHIKRHGRGSMFYTDGSRYFGYWKDNRREGFGVFLDTKGNRFIGNWIDDHKTGHGFLLYCDGTRYEGEFEGDAKVGHDTLITANGDSLAGDWRGDSLFRASFSKGNLQNAPKVVKSLLLHSLNSTCNDKDSNRAKYTSHTKWKGILPSLDGSRGLFRQHINLAQGDFKSSLTNILRDEKSPFSKMISTFVDYFNWMYRLENISQTPNEKRKLLKDSTLLYLALDDLHSFLHFARVNITKSLMLVPKHSVYRELNRSLSEIIFPQIYSTLFPLYKAINQKKEIQLFSKLIQLENVTFADIGIKEKFWLQQDQTPDSTHSDDSHIVSNITASPQNEPYLEVIKCIQKMIEQSTPTLKIESLIEASNTIVSCVDNYYKKKLNNQRNVFQRETHPHFSTETLPPLMEDLPLMSSSLQTSFSPLSQQSLEKRFEDEKSNIFKESDAHLSQTKAVDDNEVMTELRQMKSFDGELSSTSVSDLKQPQRPRRGSVGSFTLPKTLSSPVLKRKAVTPSNNTTSTKNVEINTENKDTETTETNSHQKKHVRFASDTCSQVIAMGAEDKFPILIYAIIKSKTHDLISNLHFLSDFCSEFFINNQDEAQYRITEMKSALDFIMKIDVNLRDTTGCFIPLHHIEGEILDVLKEVNIKDPHYFTCVGMLLKKINSYQSIKITDQEQKKLVEQRESTEKLFGKLKMALFPRKRSPSQFKIVFSFHFPIFLYSHIGEQILQFSARCQLVDDFV